MRPVAEPHHIAYPEKGKALLNQAVASWEPAYLALPLEYARGTRQETKMRETNKVRYQESLVEWR